MRGSGLVTLALIICCAVGGCQRRTPEERMEKAMTLFQQRDTLGATLEARELIKKHPDDPRAVDAHMLLAQVYMTEQRPDDALAELEIVLNKLSQKDARGQAALRMYLAVLQQQKQYQKALDTIDKYQKEYANDEGTSLSFTVARADILSQEGKTTPAREILTSLYQGTTEPAVLQLYRDMIARTYITDNDVPAAIAFYEQELARTQESRTQRELILNLSVLHAEQQEYEQARQWLDRATRLFDEALQDEVDVNRQTELALQIADAYARIGNLKGAAAVYARLFGSNINQNYMPPVVNGMTETLLREGKTTDAIEFLRNASRRFPQSQLAAQAAQLETMSRQGMVEQMLPPETSTVVLSFERDELLIPRNLPGSDDATTATDTHTTVTEGVEGMEPGTGPSTDMETTAAPLYVSPPDAVPAEEPAATPALPQPVPADSDMVTTPAGV